jgi:hypothetical protein
MSALGPISAALEAELRKQVQQNGIVIWQHVGLSSCLELVGT